MRPSIRFLPTLCAIATLSALSAAAQTSPARDPAPGGSMLLADYLGLLAQISPAAQEGAQAYLEAFQRRCRRPMTTAELRRSMSQGKGDPVLMGMIRASHLRDTAARDQFVQQLRCPSGEAR